MSRIAELDAQRPELEKFVTGVAEKMGSSAMCLCLFTENYAKGLDSLLQFALAMVMDKPIYLLAPEGVHIPENVKLVAKGIEFYKPNDETSFKAASNRLITLATSQGFAG